MVGDPGLTWGSAQHSHVTLAGGPPCAPLTRCQEQPLHQDHPKHCHLFSGGQTHPDSEQLPWTHSVIRRLHDGKFLNPALFQHSPVRTLPWRCISHRIHSEQERKRKRRLHPMYTYQCGLRNLNAYLNTFLRLGSPLGTGPMVGPATRMRCVCWAVCSEPARELSTPESLTAGRPRPLLKGLPVRSSAPGARDLDDLFTPPSSKSQVPPTLKGRVLVT